MFWGNEPLFLIDICFLMPIQRKDNLKSSTEQYGRWHGKTLKVKVFQHVIFHIVLYKILKRL